MNKNNYNGTTSELNISSELIYDCGGVLQTLYECGIKCTVSPHKSVIYNDNKCQVERGCLIKLNGLNHVEIEKKVWNPLKDKFGLKCAHLHVHGYYIGCILDFIRPSDCK
jgi:hypothetical protein